MDVWTSTSGVSSVYRWVAHWHGPHAYTRDLTVSYRGPSSSCGVVVVSAGNSGVISIVVAVSITVAAAAVMMKL